MDGFSAHEQTERSYDALADEYAGRLGDELEHKPLDRALLRALAEGRVPGLAMADVGCGPGHVAAWLAAQGVPAVGIDISEAMLEVGRRLHRGVEFRRGDLLSLPAGDGEFGALLAFYSIIHLEPSELAAACIELHRVLAPGGQLLVSFHVGDEIRHVSEMWGRRVDLDFRFLEPGAVADALGAAGLDVEARLERGPYPEEVETRRAYLLARRA